MKKNFVIIGLLSTLLLLTLACAIGYEGLQISDDPEPQNPLEVLIQEQTEPLVGDDALESASAATPAAGYQAVEPSGSTMEETLAGKNVYSVSATNFECTCQATNNMKVDMNFTGNQLEITNEGGAPMIYEKVADNKYQRTFMGYYLLTSGEGADTTETKVEEENRTVIILTGTGYVMENYKGTGTSPCCYYDFTLNK